jgi:hypothetical protein
MSRMTRNKHQICDKPVPTIVIEDTIFIEDIDFDATGMDSPQYDFVSNLPPFIKDQEGFLGI